MSFQGEISVLRGGRDLVLTFSPPDYFFFFFCSFSVRDVGEENEAELRQQEVSVPTL